MNITGAWHGTNPDTFKQLKIIFMSVIYHYSQEVAMLVSELLTPHYPLEVSGTGGSATLYSYFAGWNGFKTSPAQSTALSIASGWIAGAGIGAQMKE